MLNYGNSAEALRQNGFVPAPLSDAGLPLGPFAVRQMPYHMYAENDPLSVGVLTGTPIPRFDGDPVQDAKATWLATLTVKVRDGLVSEAAAIVAKRIGAAKCPVRVSDDGALVYVFRTSEQFGSVDTSPGYEPDHAAVLAAPSFVPLDGQWQNGLDLLDVRRSELPELTKASAEALVAELDALLDARAPRLEPTPRPPRRPVLERGQRLLYGNQRALYELREKGWNLTPVRWGEQQAETTGYVTFNNTWLYTVPLDNHGVGVSLWSEGKNAQTGRGLVTIETVTPFRPDVDAAIRSLGRCLVRSVVGDTSRRLYVFQSQQGGADQGVFSPYVHVAVRRRGFLVLSGADENGREYQWDSDLLQTRVDSLARFEGHDVQRLQRALEPLPFIKRARRG